MYRKLCAKKKIFTIFTLFCFTSYQVHSSYYKPNASSILENNRFPKGIFPRLSSRKYADGCYNVYLDVGSNIGVQVRKIFEPEKYSGALILPIFDIHFGKENRAQTTCAFGFEPNSMHTHYLQEVESYLHSKNSRCTFFTNTAAALFAGNSVMHHHSIDFDGLGGSLLIDKLESEQRTKRNSRKHTFLQRRSKQLTLASS